MSTIVFIASVLVVIVGGVILLVARQRNASAATHMPLQWAVLSLIFVIPMGGAMLTVFPPMQSLFVDFGCPPGWVMVGTSSHVDSGMRSSTYLGAACYKGRERQNPSGLYQVACSAFGASVVVSIGLFLSGVRWLRVRREEAQREAWERES